VDGSLEGIRVLGSEFRRRRNLPLDLLLEKKTKHMYWGTLNILDMLRKTFLTWTEFFLGDMFFL